MKIRARIEIGAARLDYPDVNTAEAWRALCGMLREALAEQTDGDRCASAIVSLHFADERCDHE